MCAWLEAREREMRADGSVRPWLEAAALPSRSHRRSFFFSLTAPLCIYIYTHTGLPFIFACIQLAIRLGQRRMNERAHCGWLSKFCPLNMLELQICAGVWPNSGSHLPALQQCRLKLQVAARTHTLLCIVNKYRPTREEGEARIAGLADAKTACRSPAANCLTPAFKTLLRTGEGYNLCDNLRWLRLKVKGWCAFVRFVKSL